MEAWITTAFLTLCAVILLLLSNAPLDFIWRVIQDLVHDLSTYTLPHQSWRMIETTMNFVVLVVFLLVLLALYARDDWDGTA